MHTAYTKDHNERMKIDKTKVIIKYPQTVFYVRKYYNMIFITRALPHSQCHTHTHTHYDMQTQETHKIIRRSRKKRKEIELKPTQQISIEYNYMVIIIRMIFGSHTELISVFYKRTVVSDGLSETTNHHSSNYCCANYRDGTHVRIRRWHVSNSWAQTDWLWPVYATIER